MSRVIFPSIDAEARRTSRTPSCVGEGLRLSVRHERPTCSRFSAVDGHGRPIGGAAGEPVFGRFTIVISLIVRVLCARQNEQPQAREPRVLGRLGQV
jgi:hypothetical protein